MQKWNIPAYACRIRAVFASIFIITAGYAPYSFAHYLDPTVLERAKKATVAILAQDQETSRRAAHPQFVFRGTGIHIGDGFIITARHVVEIEDSGKRIIRRGISIITTNFYELDANLVGENEATDIAVYRIVALHRLRLTVAVPFAKFEPTLGEDVFTFGFPLNWGLTVKFGHLGNTSAYLQIQKMRLFQLDLPICSGDSGSGIFNESGELVGMMNAIIQTENVQGMGGCSRFSFAAPVRLVKNIVVKLIDGHRPKFSSLGIQMEAVKIGERWAVGVRSAEGPALAAGIKKNDIILAINKIEILDAAHLKSFIVEETEPGDKLVVRVFREGKEILLTVITGDDG